jgi:DNA-binding SARP family transcriptional activator/tetratricopeptide (TPR) repeat protein
VGIVSEPLTIRLFGELAVQYQGRALPVHTPPRVPVLLAYLVLHRDRLVRRSELAFTLWPDEPEETALANLRRHLNYLRSALPLGNEWLLVDKKFVRLNPSAPVTLDTAEFERLSARAESRADAVNVYGGELLAGMSDDFPRAERERLLNLQIANLVYLVSAERAARNYRAALGYTARLHALDSWREDVIRQIIVLRSEAGDRAGALAAYEEFAARLAEELGTAPMRETQDAFACVLEGRSPPVADFVNLLEPREEPRELLPFVGRGAEMSLLRAAWTRAARGRGSVALIVGAAGLGKSRLVQRLCEDVVEQGGHVAFGRASDDQQVAYEPFAQALAPFVPMLGRSTLDDAPLLALATLLPELAVSRAGLNAPVRLAPADERVRLFEAAAGAFAVLAAARPLAIVLEDVHWTTEATLELTAFLANRLAELPVLLVATYREEELARAHPVRELRRSLARQQRLTSIALAPLERDDLSRLVDELAATSDSGADLASLLYERSEGNPFFAGEILRDAIESGAVRIDSGKWRVIEQLKGVPAALMATLERRIERLSAPTRPVAAVCAVIGRTFDVELVSEAGGWSGAQTLAALGELVDRKMILESKDQPGNRFAFAHDLMRQALYVAQASEARRRRHQRVGEVLESLHTSTYESVSSTLALHFDRGGDASRAVPHYLAAARRALALPALHESVDLATRGLELTDDVWVSRDLLLVRSSALQLLAQHEGQMKDLGKLLEIAETQRDAALEFDVRCRLIVAYRDLADPSAEGLELEQLEHLAIGGTTTQRARMHLERGRSRQYASRLGEAQVALREAFELLDPASESDAFVEVGIQLADIARFQGDVPAATRYREQCAEVARATGSPMQEMACLRAAMRIASIQDHAGELYLLGHELLNIARRCGDIRVESDAHCSLTFACTTLGRFDEGLEHSRAALQSADLLQIQISRSGARRAGAVVLRLLGRYQEAEAWQLEALEIARGAGDELTQALALPELAHTYVLLGNQDRAQLVSLEALTIASRVESSLIVGVAGAIRGLVLLHGGRGTDALELLETGVEAGRHVFANSTWLGAMLGALALARSAAGDMAGAQTAAREAEAHLVGKPVDVDAAYGHWAGALIAQAAGDDLLWHKLSAAARDALGSVASNLEPQAKAEFLTVPWHVAVRGDASVKEPAGSRRKARAAPALKPPR